MIFRSILALGAIGAMFLLILYLVPIKEEVFMERPSMNIVDVYHRSEWESRYPQLLEAYGQRKELPQGFELAALLALSHYPELAKVRIEFVVKKTPIPLASRPDVKTLLNKRENRKYCVIISDGSLEAMDYLLTRNLPFNSQVGIIGHELAHTAYYQDKTLLQVLKMGAFYLFPEFRSTFEKNTDIRATYAGLGPQLIDYANYVRYHPESTYREDGWIDRYYLTAEEIDSLMETIPGYRRSSN